MPLDTSIYQGLGQQNTLGQLADSINQFTENRARLADLARQQKMQDVQMQRQDEQWKAQQAEGQRQQATKHKQELNLGISQVLRQGGTPEQAMQWGMQESQKRGIDPALTQQHLMPIFQSGKPNEELANYFEEAAYPEQVAKQRFEQRFATPKPQDEGSPVTVMQQGKPMTIMSKSGRIVGEAVPTKALVNIGVNEPAPKVSPGTRVWREGGEWKTEVMKGTPQWQALKSKESTDRAFVQNFVPSLEKNVQDIEKLTKHKGFDNIFGKIGSIESLDVLPSTLEARAQLAQVVGAMETAGMQMQKSTAGSAGSMSEKEWPKMQTYLNLVKTATTSEDAKRALLNAVQSYKRMQEVGKESYMNEWGTGQFGDKTVIDRLSKGNEKPANSSQSYEGDKEARYQAWKARQGK